MGNRGTLTSTKEQLKSPTIVETNSQSTFTNSTKHGIGRLEGIGSFLFLNNIGKNIQVTGQNISDSELIFAETSYAGQDEESLLDLDIHAFLHNGFCPYVLASNHFGTMRAFGFPPNFPVHSETASLYTSANNRPNRFLHPTFELQWVGDTERLILAGDRLISTSPRGHETSDPPQAGLLVSEPLTPLTTKGTDQWKKDDQIQRYRIQYHVVLADWGFTTGVAKDPSGSRLAIVSEKRLGVFQIRRDGSLEPIWERELPFAAGWIRFHPSGDALFVAGPGVPLSDANFDDWDSISGGGLIRVETADGTVTFHKELTESIAWGYGSVPLAIAPSGSCIYAVDRQAALHRFDASAGSSEQLYAASAEPGSSLGLAHMTIFGNKVVAGFNRGGYKLYVYDSVGTQWFTRARSEPTETA